MPMSREIIRFNGRSVRLRLDEPPEEGRESKSQKSGELEFQYAANSNSNLFYLNRSGREALLKSGAQAGDEVAIHKLSNSSWRIEVLSDAVEAAEPAANALPAPEPTRKSTPRDFAERLALESSQRRAWAQGRKESTGNPHPPVAVPPARGSSHLAQALCLAIDAAVEASEYARAKNFGLTFLGSDIRAMANTVLIGDQKRSES